MRATGLLGAVALLAACADAPAPSDAALTDDLWHPEAGCDCATDGVSPADAIDGGEPATCTPLTIDPPRLRLATGTVASLSTAGGSRALVIFHATAPETLRGTTVSLGGRVTAGAQAVTFEVTAEDGPCDLRASAQVEVVGPLTVEPAVVRVQPGASVRFAVTGSLGATRWTALNPPAPTIGTLDAATQTFTAGTASGTLTWLVQDTASSQEVPVTVQVTADAALRPRVPVLLVPANRRVRLDWVGGSDALTPSLDNTVGGSLVREGSELWFDATGARAGATSVRMTDRATGSSASVRIVVGAELVSTPAVRGEGTPWGSLAWGDVNGDGRPDLAVGHPTMQSAAPYAGRVALYLARPDGSLPAEPTSAVDGARANDLIGRALAVGDVTRDGRAEVIVGSGDRSLNYPNVGTVEVWSGNTDGIGATPVQTLLGAAERERFGAAFALEDVAGDDNADLVVVAPGARGPAIVTSPCTAIGRVQIFRGSGGAGRPFEPTPWQTLEYFLPDPMAGRCHNTEMLYVGNAPAFFDVDGDGARDLVIGVPLALATDRTEFLGRVIVYRGLGRMGFEPRPSWVLSLAEPMGLANFGAGVEVVPTAGGPVLMVRAPRYHRNPVTNVLDGTSRGAVFAFAAGTFGAGTMTAPRFVTTALARARFFGDTNAGAGGSGAVGDVDGDGAADYLVGGWVVGTASPGQVWMFSAAAIASAMTSGTLTPTWTTSGAATEGLGSALAIDRTTTGRAAAVAVTASMRTTSVGYFTGGVDVLAPGAAASAATRWMSRAPLMLPQRAGGDSFGSSITLGALGPGRTGDALVGAPQAHLAVEAVVRPRAGTISTYPSNGSPAAVTYAGNRDFAQLGTAVTTLDFNGDGRTDVAVGDASASAGGWDVVRLGQVAPSPDPACFLHTAAGALVDASAANRGMVRIYTQRADGSFVEGFRVYGREQDGQVGLRGGVGGAVANALDVNNDGRQDLLVMHSAIGGGGGAEVILGRADDTMGRVQVVCGDPATAPWWPVRTAASYSSVAGIGDIDGDGCSEAVVGYLGNQRPGVSLQFGFGPRCARGHAAPFELPFIIEASRLDDNRVGVVATRTDDDYDRVPQTSMGSLVAGVGDVTGDGVPDVLTRQGSWALGDSSDPVVEVLSGAYLAGLCPDRRCPAGRNGPLWSDGDYRRVCMQNVEAPHRFVLHSTAAVDPTFASSIAGSDVDGDGVVDVLIGASASGFHVAQTGAVMAWRGGSMGAGLGGNPWLLAVGDASAVTRFGASAAAMPSTTPPGAWVAVGAPGAAERGPSTGTAFRWFVPR